MLSIARKLSPLTLPRRPLLPLPFSLSSLLPPSLLRRFSSPPPSSLCPGCGIPLQPSDPFLPGFFSLPSPKPPLLLIPSPSTSLSLKSGHLQHPSPQSPDLFPSHSIPQHPNPLICSRCHSLRHYGRVKHPSSSSENLLPEFDFHSKISSPSGPPSVALLVVDAADFDGSFPRRLAGLLAARNPAAWKESKPANFPRIVVAVTKSDLLPPSVSPEELRGWARRRADASGAARLAGLHVVSAARDWGVRDLVRRVEELAGPRGNVWAVGAQNAGKSTLINAMGRCAGRMMQLTEAPVPGTTLGIVRVEGVLCGQAKLFDTPGIVHPYQITTRLTREEQKLVHMSKELAPRTYRIKADHSVHIGGLMRLDVEESSADSIYLTVWASPLLPLHMGKKENSHKMIEDHFGRQLQPPIGENRVSELGKLVRTEFRVTGDSWDESSTDIAAAGLGWIAVCLKGEAVLGVWTYDGIDVVSRSSLITRKAKIFEETGFTVSKIVAQADSIFNKKQNKSDKKKSVHKMKLD